MNKGVAVAICITFACAAIAYRPFVSTDAAVADRKTAEFELGCFTLAHVAGHSTYGIPGVRLNYGVANNLEAIGEFVIEEASSEHTQIVDAGVFLKGVLREGVLQDRAGLSVAVEAGPLLPSTLAAEQRAGFLDTGIVSGQLLPLTYHLNLGGGVDRVRTNPLIAWGVIAELPLASRARVRLVAELNGESAVNRPADNSGLMGFIWGPAWKDFVLDIGIRKGFSHAAADWSITAGVTFSLPSRSLAQSEV